jgi:hypothetical protein
MLGCLINLAAVVGYVSDKNMRRNLTEQILSPSYVLIQKKFGPKSKKVLQTRKARN